MPLEVQHHKVPHLKALRYDEYETRGVSFGSNLSICQDVLKNGNLLHKQGFFDFQTINTAISYSHEKDKASNFMKKVLIKD